MPLISQSKINQSSNEELVELPKQYSEDAQMRILYRLADILCIDRKRCIIEKGAPGTKWLNNDILQVRFLLVENSSFPAIYLFLHEAGHALYRLNSGIGVSPSVEISFAFDECQARFFEAYLGHSKPFIRIIHALLAEEFPSVFSNISIDSLYKFLNQIDCTSPRIKADEVSYFMHIFIRYEIEKELFAQAISAQDARDEWNRLSKEYLGVSITRDKDGILQDSHWGKGRFGYFSAYALGSANASIIYDTAVKNRLITDNLSPESVSNIISWMTKDYWIPSLKNSTQFSLDTKSSLTACVAVLKNYLYQKYLPLQN